MQMTVVPDDPKRRQIAQFGTYAVWYDPLPHRPYGLFRVYNGEHYIGAQLSLPSESDCHSLERRNAPKPAPIVSAKPHRWTQVRRAGRPRKVDAQRELSEALAA